jgi:hypothetical protein
MDEYLALFSELRSTPEKYRNTIFLSLSAMLQGCEDRRLDGESVPSDRRVLLPSATTPEEEKWLQEAAARCYSRGYVPVTYQGKNITRVNSGDWERRKMKRRKVVAIPCPPEVDETFRTDQTGIKRIRDFWGV